MNGSVLSFNQAEELLRSAEQARDLAERAKNAMGNSGKPRQQKIRVVVEHRVSAGTIFKVIAVSAVTSVFVKVASDFLKEPAKRVLEKRDPDRWVKATAETVKEEKDGEPKAE